MLRVNAGETGYEHRTPSQVLGDIGALPLAGGTMTGALTTIAGSAGAPALIFGASSTTGLYRSAANAIAVSINGVKAAEFDASYVFNLFSTASAGLTATSSTALSLMRAVDSGTSTTVAFGSVSNQLVLYANGAEKARVDTNGNLLVGLTSGSNHIIQRGAATGAAVIGFRDATSVLAEIYGSTVANTSANAAACTFKVGSSGATGRSINASGTINASGADYAEYMRKADGCGTIAKGAIVGVDADGLLTDKWADAVSFLVKSTDPSYVGGDKWGISTPPVQPVFEQAEYTGDTRDEEAHAAYFASVEAAKAAFDAGPYADYLAELAAFEAALEVERQKVDRIAYAGQVPVNVLGATPGQYIVPVQDGTGIAGLLVDDAAITFAQYRKAVGIVQNILPDGRANVRVKVA